MTYPASSLIKRTRRVSLAVLNSLRLALGGRIQRVPVSQLTNEYAFSMDPHGWNYFRALVAEVDQHPNLCLEDSVFYQFFQHPRVRAVRTLNDLLFLHDPQRAAAGCRFHLGTYPWGHWNRAASLVGGKPFGLFYDHATGESTRDLWGYRRNPWYDPGDPHPLSVEWSQTTHLLRSLKQRYRPYWNGSLPEVTLLVRAGGEQRAVRYNGQHRMAILSHLGHASVDVALSPQGLGTIREEDVEDWYYVRHGLCAPAQALEIFHAFFDLNGRERIQSLGLPTVY